MTDHTWDDPATGWSHKCFWNLSRGQKLPQICHSQPGRATCHAIYPHTNLLRNLHLESKYCFRIPLQHPRKTSHFSLPHFSLLLASDMLLLSMLKFTELKFMIWQCTCPCTYHNTYSSWKEAVSLPTVSHWQHGSTPQWNYFQEQKLCIFQRTRFFQWAGIAKKCPSSNISYYSCTY